MNEWEKAYTDGFLVNTPKPSEVILLAQDLLPKSGKVLDIGCGNGRNTIYFAKKGYFVDAIDIVDLDFLKEIPKELLSFVNYKRISCLDYSFDSKYDIIVMARLIQYLTIDELDLLFKKATSSLKQGYILLSYSATGKTISEKYGVNKYNHPLPLVLGLVEKHNLKAITIKEGNKVGIHLSYKEDAITYDIVLQLL